MKLTTRLVEKPWGQTGLPARFVSDPAVRIGEIWFEHPAGEPLDLMIKYLFTSERLSIQVHPNDEQARAAGFAAGKEEMWIILAARPDARIGLGLTRDARAEELRAAVADGSIEQLVDWRPTRAGDLWYNPAGTIHAIGGGLVVLEVQQATDCTYRLYDYGRPRALHLDAGIAVAQGTVHRDPRDGRVPDSGSAVLVDGPVFGVAWCDGALPVDMPLTFAPYQLAPVHGSVMVDGCELGVGECALVQDLATIELASDAGAVLAWSVAAD